MICEIAAFTLKMHVFSQDGRTCLLNSDITIFGATLAVHITISINTYSAKESQLHGSLNILNTEFTF